MADLVAVKTGWIVLIPWSLLTPPFTPFSFPPQNFTCPPQTPLVSFLHVVHPSSLPPRVLFLSSTPPKYLPWPPSARHPHTHPHLHVLSSSELLWNPVQAFTTVYISLNHNLFKGLAVSVLGEHQDFVLFLFLSLVPSSVPCLFFLKYFPLGWILQAK